MSITRVSLKDPGFYSYLIITPLEFERVAESLKIYREKEGITTKVLTVEEIASMFPGQDIAEKIRNAIRFYYLNMGTRYVFLAADNNKIPARIVLVRLGYGEDDYLLSDYYYMCLDGNWNKDGDYTYGEIEDSIDIYPEVSVTRGTFQTVDEFADYFKRIKAFEKKPVIHVNRALFHSSTIQSDADGSQYVDQIADALPGTVEKIFLYQDDSTITISAINNYLYNGVGYFLTMAHGDINGFYANYSDIYYGISAIPQATTSATLVDIFSCHSGAIDRMCLLKAFFKKGITIAARANSRNDFSFTTPMRVTFYELLSQGKTLGEATAFFRLPYLSYVAAGDNGYRYVALSMITLGEPLLKFYTNTPVRLFADYNIDFGSRVISVFVHDDKNSPVEDAVVTFYKENVYFVQDTTDIAGTVKFPLNIFSQGLHYLTVTGENYVRTDTVIDIPQTDNPEILGLDIIGDRPPVSGDSITIWVKVKLPYFYPTNLVLSYYIQDTLFAGDTLELSGGTEEFRKVLYIPYFSGVRKMEIQAHLMGNGESRDTVFEVLGPSVTISGIGMMNDTLYIWLGNSGGAIDYGIIKLFTAYKDTAFSIVLPPKEVHRVISTIRRDDFPVQINIHTNVFDTTIKLKNVITPSPPSGLNATSISKGVILKWNKADGKYNLYRGTDSMHLLRINIDPLLFPCYKDEGLSYNETYYYAVTVIDSNGFESQISQIVRGIPNPPLKPGWPAAGTGLGYSSPLVADITPLYPGKEIVIGSFEDSLLYAYSKDGILLPGWPVKIDGIIYASPAGYDFDGDGFEEIVIAGFSCRKLWVFKGDGTTLDGWPVYLPNGNFTGPAIGDVNHDSLPEIVFVSRKGGVYVYNMFGQMLDSLHLYSGGFSPPTLGDIDNDDTVEIITGCKVDTAGLWVMHMAGDSQLVVDSGFPKGPFGFHSPLVIGDVDTTRPGLEIFGCSINNYAVLYTSWGDTMWTRPTNNLNYFYAPSISDIDGDGTPELLVNQGTGVAVLRNNGDYLHGYPTIRASGGLSQCITVDLDGDGKREIIKGSVDGNLYALTNTAEIYPGFPIDLLGYAYPTSTIADLDNDGKLELITASFANLVFVYELGIPDSFIGDWPTYQHDNQRTGNYNYIFEPRTSSVKENKENHMSSSFLIRSNMNLMNLLREYKEFEIYDVMGRLVSKCPTKRYRKSLYLKAGVYFVIGRTAKENKIKKRLIVLP